MDLMTLERVQIAGTTPPAAPLASVHYKITTKLKLVCIKQSITNAHVCGTGLNESLE